MGGYSSQFSSYGEILKTTNGGAVWTSNKVMDVVLQSVFFPDANTGYVVSSHTIMKTTNGGQDWIEQYSGTINGLYSVFFTDVNTGFVVGTKTGVWYKGLILKTTNGGQDWTEQLSGTDDFLYSVFFTDSNTGYAVGGAPFVNGTIIKTTNGGADWTIQNSGTTNLLSGVYFTDANTGYAVGQNGTILKTTNGGEVGINDYAYESKLLKIYPNPSSKNITVERPELIHKSLLTIINLNGQEIIRCQITEPTTTIDVSTLPSGIYFVRLTGERTVHMGKLVKQ